jgi:hypothetical protein
VSTLDARYVLVPIDAMIPSHQPMMGFEPAPGYPAELQERDYQGSQLERRKVERGAEPSQFKPRLLLGDNQDALTGPPVIEKHGWVLGGNGRTMILQVNAERYGDLSYQKALQKELSCNACYGLTNAPVEGHVLARLLEGEYDPVSISALLNAPLTTELGREAAAVSLGMRIPKPVLERLAVALEAHETWGAAIDSLSSYLPRALMDAAIITPATQAEWLRSERGHYLPELIRAGKDRLRDAIVGVLVKDVDALRTAPPSLLRLYEHIAPQAVVLESFDPDNETGYNWVPALRMVAREASDVVLLSDAEFRNRYRQQELFDEPSESEIRLRDRRARSRSRFIAARKARYGL